MQNMNPEKKYSIAVERDLEAYPPTLKAKHIAKYLNVGINTAYKMMKSGNFPTVMIPNSRLMVTPKALFVLWYARELERKALDERGELNV